MKLTKLERNWILYDVGNSAFTLLASTVIQLYFYALATNSGISSTDYMAFLGYATSAATLLVALIGPTFGTLADTKGYKKPVFAAALAIGAIGCVSMGFATQWLAFLVLYVIAKTGYSASLVFYDSMLPDVAEPDRVDQVSAQGYAWGYIGSCIPFVACLVLFIAYYTDMLPFQLGLSEAMISSFVIVAVWWVLMTVPLLKTYRQKYYVEKQTHAVRESFARLGKTFRSIQKEKKAFVFLLAFFFYIDGVYTIIDMATSYGTALGLNQMFLLLALLVTQFVAFPFSILFGKLSKKRNTEELITICIAAYFGIALFAMFLQTQLQFWILAVLVGMFQGGIQALSRSYFTKIIPAEQSGEFFGLMDICGKGASFMGTMLVSVVTQTFDNANLGVGAIAILFVIGLILFRKSIGIKGRA